MDRATNRFLEQRFATIMEVNMEQGIIHVTDEFNTDLILSIHVNDPIVTIPVLGERWLIERRNNDWYLSRRMESGQEPIRLQDMLPGETRIPGSILHLDQIQLQGGGTLFGENGSLKYRDPNGTVTPIVKATWSRAWNVRIKGA